MGCSAGSKIETDELKFSLSGVTKDSLDSIPGDRDHGISDWYCFNTGNIGYSAIYPDTKIIEVDTNGNESVKVYISTPSSGTFSATAGRRYYGTKAIHLLGSGGLDQHDIVPLTYAGTSFANHWVRNSPQTYNVFALHDSTTVYFYDNNAAGGITGTSTSSASLSKGQSTTFSSTSVNTWQFFSATNPVIMSVAGSGADCHRMAPSSNYSYRRRNAYEITVNNGSPSNQGTYVVYDTSVPVVTLEIADGAGGDSTQGIGIEYLSNTYSWGEVLSDYHITAPYANTTVHVSYWASNQWNLGETHSLNGSQTSPAVVDRDGTQGFGVDGTNISGLAANLASGATLWKWESNNPIAVTINNNADDEETLLGWMRNNYRRKLSNYTGSFSIKNKIRKGEETRIRGYGKTTISEFKTNDSDNYFTFDGTDDYFFGTISGFNPDNGCTLEMVVRRPTTPPAWRTYFNIKPSSSNTPFFEFRTNGANFNTVANYFGGADYQTGAYTINSTDFYHMVATYDGAGNIRLYVNGDLKSTKTGVPAFAIGSNPRITIGRAYSNNRPTNIELGDCKVYQKELTQKEIKRNYIVQKRIFNL